MMRWKREKGEEMGGTECIEDFGVDGVVFEVDEVHLLANLLERRLGAQGSQVTADEAVCLCRDLVQVNILRQFHILRVDAKNFQPVQITHSIICEHFLLDSKPPFIWHRKPLEAK